ncbi:MAG: NUDIX domain-containing protein [candidate division Zixibacteria bacterium]|nr:NUDIX domain-containing protein [candidate division Zixibacteria bacterium]
MTTNHERFDEAKLFERKKHHCGFRFCPLCGKELREGEVEGRIRVYCPDQGCGYVFYQNPVPAAGVILVENERVLLVKRAHPPRVGWWCIPAGFMDWHGVFMLIAILMLYFGRIVGGEMRPADDALEVRWFHLDELPDQIAFEAHIRALADYNRRFRGHS